MKKELLMIALCMGMIACKNSNAKNESKAVQVCLVLKSSSASMAK